MAKRPIPQLTIENWKVWGPRPVAVYWEDAAFSPDPEGAPVDPEVAITFGVIKEWNEKKLELVGEVFPVSDGQRRVAGIPAGMVRHVIPWKGWRIPEEYAHIILKAMARAGASLVR